MLSCALTAVFFCIVYGAANKKTEIFYVGDTIVLGNRGDSIFSDKLQFFFDKEYGTDRVSVYNYSFFDMNTAQCLRLVTDLLSKPDNNTEFVVIMAGEANYYNLDGLTDYLASAGRYHPKNALINENDIDAVKKLNEGVAGIYNSPAAFSNKAFLQYLFAAAYRSIAGSSPKKVEGYVPKIIPSFLVLSEDNPRNDGDASSASRYRLAWNLINAGKFKEAETVIKEMLRNNPFDSGLYYALGSLYLAESNPRVSEALKMFKDGILINPFDKANQSYKGLAVMYMSYDGKIISEILYFARAMKSFLGELIPEINAITAINTADYHEKTLIVNEWIVSDIKRIDSLCKSKGVQMLAAEYPLDAKSGAFLRNSLSYGNIVFVDNRSVSKNTDSSAIADAAKNVMEVINNKIKK
jgi:tetratricopeptide (TPR) repeat protein